MESGNAASCTILPGNLTQHRFTSGLACVAGTLVPVEGTAPATMAMRACTQFIAHPGKLTPDRLSQGKLSANKLGWLQPPVLGIAGPPTSSLAPSSRSLAWLAP